MAARLVFFGSSPFAELVMAELLLSPYQSQIVGLFTRAPQPAGRGMKLTPTRCEILARERGIPVFTPTQWRDGAAAAALAGLEPDLGIVVAYGMILPQNVLDIPKLGCVNLHGSLLPRWRGAAPIERAILAGDAETGVTLMQMVAKMDAGPILAQSNPIEIGDKSRGDLHDELAELAGTLLIENLPALLAGNLKPMPQVPYAEKIDRNRDCLIDFSQPADQVARQIRAFAPTPGAFAYFHRPHSGGASERIKILAAKTLPKGPYVGWDRSHPDGHFIGLVITVNDGKAIFCGKGDYFCAISPTLIQRAGKSPIAWEEFSRSTISTEMTEVYQSSDETHIPWDEFSRTIAAGDYFSNSPTPRG
ncbi:MAG: methionyl-tRNA formyltransferase [Candidatus Symbiobacter sp.]|nr:methionyl-tRNA formyltransferase [Candidatus Symbiobacter sp.]